MNYKNEEFQTYSIESLLSAKTKGEAREFDLFRFEYFAKDIEHLKQPHRHYFYTLILVTDGVGSHDIDFTSYDILPNRMFLIAPGQIHAWKSLKRVRGFVMLFTDSFVALSKGRKLMPSWPLFKTNQDCFLDLNDTEASQWIEEFMLIETELKTSDPFSRDAIFYSLGSLLVRASRLYIRSPRITPARQDLLFTFQELIEKQYTRLRTPKDYASLLHITPNYLNALCRKKAGKSAGELIRQRVLLEIKRLLAHTSLSISEIAYKLNFADNSYFGRYFKKYAGVTPETFRKMQGK